MHPDAGRAARWRDLLHAAGSADHHRKLASSLQHRAAACLDRLPGSGTGGVRASTRRMAGCAIPTSSAGHAPAGAKTDPKLTFDPDHLVGAGHYGHVLTRDDRLRLQYIIVKTTVYKAPRLYCGSIHERIHRHQPGVVE